MHAAPRVTASRASHAFGEHVGEVSLVVRGPTRAALIEEAGRALAELSAEVAADAPLGAQHHVELVAPDAGALLVAWLNELLFLSETTKQVFDDLHVTHVDDRTLVATVRGRPPFRTRTAVKAATLHDVRLQRTSDGFEGFVLFDV